MVSRNKLIDRMVNVRDARLFIIATEGEKSEKQYFEGIFQSSRVSIVILETREGKSSPKSVYERLQVFRSQYDLNEHDELWLVIDVDGWKEKMLKEACAKATQLGAYLAVSSPCFELWLYLHFADVDDNDALTCMALGRMLRSRLGSYNKSNLNCADYVSRITSAIERARALHINTDERWPASTGTHVYKLVEKLIASMPEDFAVW